MSERESRSKRQRTSDVDYREKKRSKKEDPGSPEDTGRSSQNSVQKECRKLYQDIRELEDPEDGHLYCDLFLQPPSRRQYPDYYELIKNPIALNNIKAKIDKMQYTSVDDFKADVELMVSNAKKYNVKESYAYQDAIRIQKFIKGKAPAGTKASKGDVTSEPEYTPAEPVSKSATIKLPALAFGNNKQATPVMPPTDSRIKSIKLKTSVKQPQYNINNLMTAISEKNSKLAVEILESDSPINVNELVSVDMFNDTFTWSPLHAAAYFGETKVIKALMAKNANIEIHDTWYEGTPLAWSAFGDRDKAARLMVERYNASKKAKNVHGQIPLDLVSDRDDPRWAGVLTSAPLPPARPSPSGSDSTKAEPLPIIRRSSEALPPPPPIIRHDVPPTQPQYAPAPGLDARLDPIGSMRDVFKNVRNHTDQYGRLYSEIFEDLPDRAQYPEYFKFTHSPMSIQIVEDRMVAGYYPNMQAWETELTTVFQNAMAFAENSSRVHKDGKLLHRLYYRMKERYLSKIGVGPMEERQMMMKPLPPWHGEPIPARPQVKTSQLDKSTVDAAFGTANMRSSIRNRRFPDGDGHMEPYNTPAPPTAPYISQRPALNPLQMAPQAMPSYTDMPYGVPHYNKPPPSNFRPMQTFTPPAPSVLPMETPPPSFQPPPPPPVQQLQQMQAQHSLLDPEVARLFDTPEKRRVVRLLSGLKIESDDRSFAQQMDGHYFAHSVSIGQQVHTLRIKTDLLAPFKQQTGRIVVQVAYNHRRLQPSDDPSEWIATPLSHGLNVVSVTVTIDVTPSSSPVAAQDIEVQTYMLFITRP
ncbi:Bromodomain-containing protein [Umbelopsis sp. AD052]|nr:Bromodomain-containing protein [Umbelopsis sp. AD052]